MKYEKYFLSAEKLIQQVEEEKACHWENSDIWVEGQQMLEDIAEHLKNCSACADEFNSCEWEFETIAEFANEILANTDIFEHICDLPSNKKEVSEIGYYDLVRVTPTHGSTFHIPAPFFLRSQRRIDFVFALPVAKDLRGNDYFSCPRCGEKSFFSGPCCGWCQYNLDLDLTSRNHEALKRASKAEFLRRLDQGIPDLGILSAEFVVAEPEAEPEAEEEGEVIQVEGSDDARRQVDGVWQHKHEGYDYWHPMTRVHRGKKYRFPPRQVDGVWQHKHEGYDYWHPMTRVHREEKYRFPPRPSFEDSDDFVNEIVRVEGSDEVRRQVDGVWYHKHEGHDYWHLMAGVHRKQEE